MASKPHKDRAGCDDRDRMAHGRELPRSNQHSELHDLIRSLADGETESEPLALTAVDRLFEQYQAAQRIIDAACLVADDERTRQPIDLNYIAVLKDDWEALRAAVVREYETSSPASKPPCRHSDPDNSGQCIYCGKVLDE